MKVKVISGIVASLITIGVLVGFFTPVIDVAVIILAVMSVFELDRAFGLKYKPLMIFSMIFGGLVAAYPMAVRYLDIGVPKGAIITFYVILSFIGMLIGYDKLKFEQVCLSIFGSIVLPYAVGCTISLKYLFVSYPDQFRKSQCFFLVFFALSCAIFTDTFAYFCGVKRGKRKLCPKISPKKTVEGALGGIFCTMGVNLIILAVFNKFFFTSHLLTYPEVAVISIILSVISMTGDLTASAIKRNAGLKDFSNLIPGHGGIMDRLDSISFVMPSVYAIVTFYILQK